MSEKINSTKKQVAPKKKLIPTNDHRWLSGVVGGVYFGGGGDAGVGADGCADAGPGACDGAAADGADGGDGGDGG
jgi:hypothetical protein